MIFLANGGTLSELELQVLYIRFLVFGCILLFVTTLLQVPGGHGVWINTGDNDNEDNDGGSGQSGQRRGGLVSRGGYLDYVRRQEERRNYRPEQYWG